MQQQLFKVRDRRNKGWFYLDNEYLNGIGKHLGPIGIAVYVSLCRHADEDQKCFPSQKTIAEEIGAGERSVRSSIKKLEEFNIIRQEKVRQSKGQWLNNVYYLLDKIEWKYPEARDAYGKPEANNDTARGKRVHSQRQQVPTKNTNTNNTNKKKTNFSFSKKNKKKAYYDGQEMRESPKGSGKLWVIPKDGGQWLEFAGEKSDIKWS